MGSKVGVTGIRDYTMDSNRVATCRKRRVADRNCERTVSKWLVLGKQGRLPLVVRESLGYRELPYDLFHIILLGRTNDSSSIGSPDCSFGTHRL